MCVLLVTFPPSKNFEPYLRGFLSQRTGITEGRVDVLAKHCVKRLAAIAKKGPRGKPPTLAEIETASVCFRFRVHGASKAEMVTGCCF
jgi:Rho GTPase-activating protein 39